MFKYSNIKSQRGVSLYLTVLILAIVLSISLGMSRVLVGQIKMIGSIGNSVVAFYAADTGTERVLYGDKLCRADCSPLCQPLGCGGEGNECSPPGCVVEGECQDRGEEGCECDCPSYCVDYPYSCSGLPNGYQIPQIEEWENLGNNSKYKATFYDNSINDPTVCGGLPFCFESIGTYQGVRRAIEASRQ